MLTPALQALAAFRQAASGKPKLRWRTQVGKLKLLFVNGTKTVGKHVGDR